MVRLEPTTDKMSAMSKDISELLKKAFALPTEARAALAGSLLDSLDDDRDDNAEAEWEVEITRRLQELRTGMVATVPWHEVRRRLTARFGKRG
jgi:putative addiction module component (TIGR02574 family)